MSADKRKDLPGVVVIGLGRFGASVARSLAAMGHEVLGIDDSMEIVQSLAEELTHVVQADSTSPATLRKLGVAEMAHAVVGIGSDIESSVLTVVALLDCGCQDIWAKAVNTNHGRILERVGANHVIYPEAEMGERVAHLVTGRMMDFFAFDDGFSVGKTRAPAFMAGKTLAESDVEARHGVTVIGVKRAREAFAQARPDTIIFMSDQLVISGPTGAVETFAALC